MSDETRHQRHTDNDEQRRPWSVLGLLVAAQFMVVLDITIVNVALPSIGRALSFARADLQWVVTAYVLCSGGLVLAGGRAADLFGRRRMFLAGLTLFTLASLICALSQSAAMLIGARAAQGAGAAILTPSALSILTTVYSGRQRATAMGLWSAVASAGIAAGAVLGGVLTSLLSWHWVFLVNVPVGLAVGALTPRIVPSIAHQRTHRTLDPLGGLSLIGGLVALVYALSRAADDGWSSAVTLALLAVAAVLLATFATVERTVAEPLIPPQVWRMRPLVSGAGMLLAGTGILAGVFFLMSNEMQDVLGYSALRAGLAFLPFVAATAVGVHLTSHVIARAGSRSLIVAGMTLVVIGALLLARIPHHATYASDLLPGLAVFGLGMGLAFPAITISMMSDVDHASAGASSGVLSTAHEVGAALGTAVLSTIAVTSSSGAIGSSRPALQAAAVAAAGLAALAALAAPSVRPPAGASVPMH
ncbi:MAG TPA: MFS transporter [Solirubrobacteraceae bacterium]|nr:MFS transporter [Solirubrobacteraceae bacterium]